MTTSHSRFVCAVLLLFATTTSCRTGGKIEVAASASEIQPLLPGMEAPDVTFFNTDGSPFTLKEALTEKPVVLIFYRGGW